MTIVPGDWIRFLSNGTLKMAEVKYVREQIECPQGLEIVTDCGITSLAYVVEVRADPRQVQKSE